MSIKNFNLDFIFDIIQTDNSEINNLSNEEIFFNKYFIQFIKNSIKNHRNEILSIDKKSQDFDYKFNNFFNEKFIEEFKDQDDFKIILKEKNVSGNELFNIYFERYMKKFFEKEMEICIEECFKIIKEKIIKNTDFQKKFFEISMNNNK